MKNLSIFQAVILGLFGIFAIGGLLFFAGVGGLGVTDTSLGEVRIWGTLDEGAFQEVIGLLAEEDDRLRNVTYEQRDSRTYNEGLTEALASGQGPDIFLLRQDFIVRHQDKVVSVPYESLSRQQFQSTFIEGAELYLAESGSLGVPVAVDPLVLYWNEDLLSSAGFVGAPQYWDEIFEIAEEVTRRDDANNIERSAIAFGEFVNVEHAKSILSTLIMQAGGEITARNDQGQLRAVLAVQSGEAAQPAQSALRFFAEFANPAKTVYSWNRSLPNSREAFAAGDLALYVGFASELPLIQNLNPNLNFATAPLPQIRNADRAVTFGNIYAFAIPRAAQNPEGALSAAFILAASEPAAMLSRALGIPSPRRDVLAQQVDGPDLVFRNMAIIARPWLDPDPEETAGIFRRMVEDVTTGALRLSEAVGQADKELNNMLGL